MGSCISSSLAVPGSSGLTWWPGLTASGHKVTVPHRGRLFPYRGSGGRLEDYEKILVERVVMGQPDLPGAVLRLPMVYGPGHYQHRLFDYLKRMDDGRPFILVERDEARQDEALRRTVDWERAHSPAQIDPSHFDYAAEDAAVRGV